MKTKLLICTTIIAIAMHTNSFAQDDGDNQSLIFPAENIASAEYNTGEVQLSLLKESGNTMITHFRFSPESRNFWHYHPNAEQTLLVLEGEDFYQEDGKEKRTIKKGDVIVTPANVRHWNGATFFATEIKNENIMKQVRLNNGVMMPAIGFGVFQIPECDTEQIVLDAIETGYRMIDTAAAYKNERAVGDALRHCCVKRENFFITTKLWVQDYEYDEALRAFDRSMKLLGLDYLDLYLLHKPFGNYYAAWRAVERLYREGRIRAIGVTSFSDVQLADLMLHNEIRPVLNQIETNPFQQQTISNAFLSCEGIQHEAWAPFSEGLGDIFNNPILKSIAKCHGKSVGQVILRWLNQRNIVVIPKTVRKERMAENLDIFDFILTDNDMKAIASLDRGDSLILNPSDIKTVRHISSLKIHK